jgi:membrane protease YdiL (CAAX protease family)
VTSTDTPPRPNRSTALLALALLAPVPSIGVIAAMFAAPGPVGQTVFTACKLWILAFPAAWYLLVERGRPSWSPPRQGGLGIGAAHGAAIAALILVGYWTVAQDRIDPAVVRQAARGVRLLSPPEYLLAAAAWTLVNSVVEEYVYRWFMVRQLRAVLPKWPAVVGSALIFTAHHVIAMSVYLGPLLTGLGSLGVLIAGMAWAWLYLRYRSIWPGWISHVLADVAVFAIGWMLLFG